MVALVTGAGSGIGLGVVECFVASGARICAMDLREERIAKLERQFPDAVVGSAGDVRDTAASDRAVKRAVDAFGRLDVFVGNAGVFDRYAKFETMEATELETAYREIFDVNVLGYLHGARAAVRAIRASGGSGSMIFTASIAGCTGGSGGVLYTAAKHGVVGIVQQLAIELAPDIRVNGVAPGGTLTDLRGLETLGEGEVATRNVAGIEDRLKSRNLLGITPRGEDLAGVYAFLADRSMSGAVTGSIVTADAGALLWRG